MDNSLVVQLGMNIQSLEQGLNKSNSLIEGFKDKLSDMAKTIAATFAVEKIGEFGVEIAKLSGQSDGVKRVFDQIQGSARALIDMRNATQGTVSDLELMKYAVQADNFNIPITQMGKLFEFAHQRALATGQSVDYLVQSIVTGIGRKSPLILDNLGISAVALREKLKGVGTESATVADVAKVVGEIAEESLNKFGIAAETTASKMEALNASWENLKVTLGDIIATPVNNWLTTLSSDLKTITDLTQIISNGRLKDSMSELNRQLDFFNRDNKGYNQQEFLDQWMKLNDLAKEAGVHVTVLTDGIKRMAFIKPEPVKFVEGGKDEEIIKNIAFYEKEIADLKIQEKQLMGSALTDKQKEIELETKKLEMLQNQFAIERDRANSVITKNMSSRNMSVNGLGMASIGLPPSEDLDKMTASVNAAKKALDDMLIKSASSYSQGWKSIFDIQRIQQFNTVLDQGMKQMVSDLAEGLGELAVGAESSNQVFATVLQAAAGMLRQLGELAVAAGFTAIALESLLENPYTAIAAGIALIALSGAVMGTAKNIMKSGGGGSSPVRPSSNASIGNLNNNSPIMVGGTVKISGQDLWVVLSNYKSNSNYTRTG